MDELEARGPSVLKTWASCAGREHQTQSKLAEVGRVKFKVEVKVKVKVRLRVLSLVR